MCDTAGSSTSRKFLKLLCRDDYERGNDSHHSVRVRDYPLTLDKLLLQLGVRAV
jgi:hypothetical protein